MEFLPCEKCVINDTCTLVKAGNEVRCTMNKDKEPHVEYIHHTYELKFKFAHEDDDTDYTKYEGYNADD